MPIHELLGINYSTASNRLVKDLLFDFVIKAGHTCFRCGKELTTNLPIDMIGTLKIN